MKKLTAMLLSLTMCLSLMAIPAQAAFIPTPDGPGVIDVGGPKDHVNPGDNNPDEPNGDWEWPGERDNMPVD